MLHFEASWKEGQVWCIVHQFGEKKHITDCAAGSRLGQRRYCPNPIFLLLFFNCFLSVSFDYYRWQLLIGCAAESLDSHKVLKIPVLVVGCLALEAHKFLCQCKVSDKRAVKAELLGGRPTT